MANANSTTTKPAATEAATTKAAKHSPTTELVAKCRLAAIAAIAEPMPIVAKAYAAQSADYAKQAAAAAADDTKDRKQTATADRWVLAAKAAADSIA